jgi:NAD(P)H-dependent flavin oxidoreductase YrpB (nitropropane dioxygenase family)
MALRTSLSRALGLEHPIVHGPMAGGPTTPRGSTSTCSPPYWTPDPW